jgi:Flp pilus assembly protein TadD
LPEAEKYYLQAVRIDPNAPDSFMQLGLLELQTNRPVQAEEHMRRAATLRPTEPNFHFGLGIVLAQRGDCVDARSEFATTLQLKPDLAAAKRESDQCKQTAGIAQTPPSVSAPVSSH